MKKAQHTPGPWRLNTQYADIEVRGPEESGVLIAVMSPWGIAADAPSPQAANARLISAAPELLAALERITKVALARGSDTDANSAYAQAISAINKAAGSHP